MRPEFYQNIRLFPDEEMKSREICEVLLQTLHVAFVDKKDEDGYSRYALSFPEYTKNGAGNFGRIIRVFAESEEDLENLNLKKICERLNGYADCSGISAVPERVYSYLKFERFHPDSSVDACISRAAKRKGITVKEAKELYKNYSPRKVRLPYLHIKSCSTDQSFPLFINCICENESKDEKFNSYGLSLGGNVPDF